MTPARRPVRAASLLVGLLVAGALVVACGNSKPTSSSSSSTAPSHVTLTMANNHQTVKLAHRATITVKLPVNAGSEYEWQRITGGAGFLPVGESTFTNSSTPGAPGTQTQLFTLHRSTPLNLVLVYAQGDNLQAATKKFSVTLDPQ